MLKGLGAMGDMAKMMKQAQAMQAKMAEMQEKMEEQEATGESGGGMVKAVINGKGYAKSISIDPSLMDAEEKDVLEDIYSALIPQVSQSLHVSRHLKKSLVTIEKIGGETLSEASREWQDLFYHHCQARLSDKEYKQLVEE